MLNSYFRDDILRHTLYVISGFCKLLNLKRKWMGEGISYLREMSAFEFIELTGAQLIISSHSRFPSSFSCLQHTVSQKTFHDLL